MMIKLITRALLATCALLLTAACVAPPALVTPSPVETPPPAAPPTETNLRAAVDPASPLNAAGSPQAFSVQLTDRAGNRATVGTRPGEPALGSPPGMMQGDPTMATGYFTGIVPLTTIRLALRDFAGVDLANVGEIALLFDQRPSGSLFVGDLEWVR
jgi:hypothetical protein